MARAEWAWALPKGCPAWASLWAVTWEEESQLGHLWGSSCRSEPAQPHPQPPMESSGGGGSLGRTAEPKPLTPAQVLWD